MRAGVALAVTMRLTGCAWSERWRLPPPARGPIEPYQRVCYRAEPAVLLRVVGDVLAAYRWDVTIDVPRGWVWAQSGAAYVRAALDTRANCSRIEISGGYPADPHADAVLDPYAMARVLYPLIYRRLSIYVVVELT